MILVEHFCSVQFSHFVRFLTINRTVFNIHQCSKTSKQQMTDKPVNKLFKHWIKWNIFIERNIAVSFLFLLCPVSCSGDKY